MWPWSLKSEVLELTSVAQTYFTSTLGLSLPGYKIGREHLLDQMDTGYFLPAFLFSTGPLATSLWEVSPRIASLPLPRPREFPCGLLRILRHHLLQATSLEHPSGPFGS